LNNLAPIVLFVYNRPDHTKQTVEALQNNTFAEDSELFIFSDAAKNEEAERSVQEVRDYLKNIKGFRTISIVEREKNWGLANSIIDGVTSVIQKYKKVIVMEDDLVTSTTFLTYMNNALNTFQTRLDIFSVTGFNYPKSILPVPKDYNEDIYLSHRCMSWSWGTWIDRWEKVDWDINDFQSLSSNKSKINHFNKGGEDLFPMLQSQMSGKIDSWAIRFCYAHSIHNAYCVYPTNTLIINEGFDGSGVHCGKDNTTNYDKITFSNSVVNLNQQIEINPDIAANFYLITKKNIWQKIKTTIRKYI